MEGGRDACLGGDELTGEELLAKQTNTHLTPDPISALM